MKQPKKKKVSMNDQAAMSMVGTLNMSIGSNINEWIYIFQLTDWLTDGLNERTDREMKDSQMPDKWMVDTCTRWLHSYI